MMDQEAWRATGLHSKQLRNSCFLKMEQLTIQICTEILILIKWTSENELPKKPEATIFFFWVFFRSLQAWHAGAGCWAGNLSLDEVSKTQFLLRGHRFFPESSKRAEVLQTAEKMVLSKNGILWAGRGGLRCWDCQLGVFWFLFLCLRRRLSCFKKVNVWPW